MTFSQFSAISRAARPGVVVSPHGDSRVSIIFPGSEKVYDFSGSYAQVLYKIGVVCVTRDDVAGLEAEIKALEASNGKTNIFSRFPVDNSEKIQQKKKELEKLMTSKDIFRVWEY